MIHRLAIAIEETSSKEKVAEHFVNCSKFYLCDLDENNILLKTETFFNPLAGEQIGFCQLPGFIKQFNVNTIIAGNMEQKIISNFLDLDINVIFAPGLIFESVLNRIVNGELHGFEVCKLEDGSYFNSYE